MGTKDTGSLLTAYLKKILKVVLNRENIEIQMIECYLKNIIIKIDILIV
jgi:hypothetical protein